MNNKSETLTIRVDQKTKTRLEAAAKQQQRSKSFVATEAIENYLSLNDWQVAGIKEAIKSLEAGDSISIEEALADLRIDS